MNRLALICVGAGSGRRFGGDKLAETIGDRTVLEWSLTALREAFPEAPLFVVVDPTRRDDWHERLSERFPGAAFVEGGARRQDSVRRGVERATAKWRIDAVVVHDAARPAVAPMDVRRVVDALGEANGAILCRSVADTVKRIDDGGFVTDTVERRDLRLALTPQAFRRESLERSWTAVDKSVEWTDEARLLELAGDRVVVVEASSPNPKLTVRADLSVVAACIERTRAGADAGSGEG